MTKQYQLKEKTWLYPGKAAWCFVSVPPDVAKNIDYYFSHQKKGFGSLRVRVMIGTTTWVTSIFPEKKTGTYLLPLKAAVRKKENIAAGDVISFTIELEG